MGEGKKKEKLKIIMFWEYFFIALRSLARRKLRSWLTIIGIFIGITAVVALISLSQGMQNSINEELTSMGTNRIIVTAGGFFMGPEGGEISTAKLTQNDLKTVKAEKGLEFVIGVVSKNARTEFNDKVNYISVWGMPTDAEAIRFTKQMSFFEIAQGRELKKSDKNKAILGYGIAKDAFDKKIKTGDNIKISSRQFEVVGIQKKSGTGLHDNLIRIPFESAEEIWNKKDELTTIFVRAKDDQNVGEVAEKIKKALRKYRGVNEGEEDFSVQTAEQTIAILNNILNIIQIVLVGIAAIALLVGGIGIMNTMYTSVVERTKEIGTFKAIGSKNSAILIIFLIESGLLGLTGGAIGAVLGIGIGKITEIVAQQYGITTLKAYYGLTLIIGALAFSFIVGAISGILPARQAARLQVIDALRKRL